MRIGIITGEFPPMQGGVGAYSEILASRLAEQGHTVRVLSGTRAEHSSNTFALDASISSWDGRAWIPARDWVRRHNLDIVSLQYQTAAFGMSPWIHFFPRVLSPVPVVTTFHDLRYPYLFPKAGKLREQIVRHLAESSAGVIATNAEDMSNLTGIETRTLIPIGSNINTPLSGDFDRAAVRQRLGATDDDFLIGYFGLINTSKGVDVLIEALSLLRQDGVPARLVFIGGTTGENDPTNATASAEIEQQIDQQGLRPYIHFTGFIDEATVGETLSAMDAVALPFADGASYRRGSLLAALHYGCAIVTTQPSLILPGFVDGETMLFVPPNDADALADALRRLYEDPLLRTAIGYGAAETNHLFDWETIIRQYIAFFERVRSAV
jgi:glycosyltransferase involved in cell wall biosynthesis